MQYSTSRFRFAVLVLLAVAVPCISAFGLQDPPESKAKGPHPWSFDEAEQQLLLYPRDLFLQYVTLKVAQRDGLSVSHLPMLQERTRRQESFDRNAEVDLFSLFSGSLAVQESLQLDAMVPSSPFSRSGNTSSPNGKTEDVDVASLVGPTVKSHPWKEMLGEKTPSVSGLVMYVPADQYYVGFRSVSRMLDVIDGGDLFAKHLYTQSDAGAFVRDTEERLRTQLAIDTNPLARPFYDLVVKEFAITGSDPFVAEGSDVTLLFQYEQPVVFQAQMEQYLKKAEQSGSDVKRTDLKVLGIPVTYVASPDRRVHVYSAYPVDGIHVRSNSMVALERTLRLILGKSENVESLGSTDEFRYIRTLIPPNAKEEDGLIYLSDSFIRRLMGAELKLTELRRLRCNNVLRMIGYSAALFSAENGRWPKSLKELEDARCLPDGFGRNNFACPCGGQHGLSKDGQHGTCSHHGHADSLRPCCEIPEDKVSGDEANAYREFVVAYEQYWQTFFDPIAIRVWATPDSYRLETIVLPLINNSLYQSMAAAMQGPTFDLSGGESSDAIMSLSFAIAKERLLKMSGWELPPDPPASPDDSAVDRTLQLKFNQSRNQLKQMVLAFHNYHDVYNQFPGHVPAGNVHPGLSWRVQILPFVEESQLYNEFHLDEPWDSEHNKTLINRMPAIYRSPAAQLKAGMTTYVGVTGKDSVFPKDKKVSLRDIVDGTSNTAMLIDANVENAVIWTKPDDLPADPEKIVAALQSHFPMATPVALTDGAVRGVDRGISKETANLLFNIHDGEVLDQSWEVYVPGQAEQMDQDPFGIKTLSGNRLTERDVYDFLATGIGNSVGLHICDSDPTFDLQLTQLLTRMFANPGRMGDEEIWIGFAVASITAPVYANVSVADAAIVDDFLSKLSEGLATTAREPVQVGFFGLQKDFYEIPVKEVPVRSFVVSFGPVRIRTFYARIEDQLIVASKLQTIQKLIETKTTAKTSDAADGTTEKAHAQMTIHREHWNAILPTMRLSWDEGARKACLDNIGPLTSTVRVLAAPDKNPGPEAIREQALSLYGGKHFCPCGGDYELDEHGRMTCTVHRDASHPIQPGPDSANAASQEMLDSFRAIQIRLSFLEDGLHAVLEIDRKASP
ncbi:MAG: DUF1559 domain-containing protein [Planctomycetaceae bacterium]